MLSHEEINKPQSTKSPEETLEPCPLCDKPLTQLTNGLAYCHNFKKDFASIDDWKTGSCLMAQHNVQLPTHVWQALRSRLSPASAAPSKPLPPEDMADDELRAAIDFHSRQVGRFKNEAAKVWRLRLRINNGTPIDQQMLAELQERQASRVVPAAPVVDEAKPENDWRWWDTHLRATGYTDLANRMLAEFKPGLRWSEFSDAAATAAPQQSDAETFVRQWVATLQDESHVTDEDVEDLVFRIIAYKTPTAAPVAQRLTKSLPPLSTLYAMFEEWRTSFPEGKQPEPDAPQTEQLIDAWIAGFAKHNEITCAAPVEQSDEQTWCDHCTADLNGVKHILCERCYREYAGPRWFDPEFNAAARHSEVAERFAKQVVGTVFDNTGASHETLKQTMIERIAAAVHPSSTSARAAAKEIAAYIDQSTPLSVGGALVRTFENIIQRHCSPDKEAEAN